MSNLVRGASVPLFDKLLASGTSGKGETFLLTPEQVQASIERELARLFNTRSRLMPSEYAQSSGTTIDYGIPDFSALSPQNPEDLQFMERALRQAIEHFEPRMSKVGVKLFEPEQRGSAARALISGDVAIGLNVKRLSFQMQVDAAQSNSGTGATV